MQIRRTPPFFLLAALAFTAAASSSARAQTGSSPQNPTLITSAPYAITQSGYYRLANNINFAATSGTIILVSASNVTIDFNGFFISGPVGNNAQTVFGVRANERSNLTLKDGTIAFCNIGVSIGGNNQANTNNVGHRIENMRVTYCYSSAIALTAAPGSRIAFNQISKIGGAAAADLDASGIDVIGAVQVNDNQINGVTATGTGVGRGIYADDGGPILVRNTITDCAVGVELGKYKDNVTVNCPTPFLGGTDAGGNN